MGAVRGCGGRGTYAIRDDGWSRRGWGNVSVRKPGRINGNVSCPDAAAVLVWIAGRGQSDHDVAVWKSFPAGFAGHVPSQQPMASRSVLCFCVCVLVVSGRAHSSMRTSVCVAFHFLASEVLMNDVRRVQVVQHQYPRRGQASRPRCRAMHAAVPTIVLRRAARAGVAVGNWGEPGRRSGHHTHLSPWLGDGVLAGLGWTCGCLPLEMEWGTGTEEGVR